MWKKSVDSMQTYLRSDTSGGMVFLAEIQDDYKLLRTGELVRLLFYRYNRKSIRLLKRDFFYNLLLYINI